MIQISQPNTTLHFKKVTSHSNIMGNDRIDYLVNKRSHSIKYHKQHLNKISYQVILTEIHRYTINKWKSQWIIKLNPMRNIAMYNSRFSLKIHNILRKGKFNGSQCGMMLRLISEHIELNEYLYNKRIKCPSSNEIPNTSYCDRCKDLKMYYILYWNVKDTNHKEGK